jgi:hypothetical protein
LEHSRNILVKFPNLELVKVDQRPVGQAYDILFGSFIRPGIGTKALSRRIGAHDIQMCCETNDPYLEWVSEFSLEGLALIRPKRKHDPHSILLEQLCNTDTLSHITLDLVITPIMRDANGISGLIPFSQEATCGCRWHPESEVSPSSAVAGKWDINGGSG